MSNTTMDSQERYVTLSYRKQLSSFLLSAVMSIATIQFAKASEETVAKPSEDSSTSMADLLSPEEREAIQQEAARQEHRESQGLPPVEDRKPANEDSVFGPRSSSSSDLTRESDRSKDSSDKVRRSRSSSTTSFTTYRPSRQSPAAGMKASPATRAFGN